MSTRCSWPGDDPLMIAYHDNEWGIPVNDDQTHFELLVLEGAQAGLSWKTVLHKRDNYRKRFKQFDPKKVAAMTDHELEACLKDEGLIRNRLKVYGARQNAIAFLAIQNEFGCFDDYVWAFVDKQPIINNPKKLGDIPASTDISKRLSKDLKKRGMTFVGPTIIYAYMQAAGLVKDHLVACDFRAIIKIE